MTEYDFEQDEMIEPVSRLFEREFGGDYGMFIDVRDKDTKLSKSADAAYVGGDRESFHAIRFEDSYDDCLFDVSGGIHAISGVESNGRWIVLALDELRGGDDQYSGIMKSECEQRDIGIITVQPKGRGLSAKVAYEAPLREGDFLSKYPDLETSWSEFAEQQLVGEEYRVVDYYDNE